jgi:ElaB/YqjD/DUF883 family membrane-anchored ribosome-binding protein
MGKPYEDITREGIEKVRDELSALTKQCDHLLKKWDADKLDKILGPMAETEAAVERLSTWTDTIRLKMNQRAKAMAKQPRFA